MRSVRCVFYPVSTLIAAVMKLENGHTLHYLLINYY